MANAYPIHWCRKLDSHAQRANVALIPTRTIAYLRVSTEKQADRGVSLDMQRAKVKVYAELYDLELLEVIVDAGESAKSLDRPGFSCFPGEQGTKLGRSWDTGWRPACLGMASQWIQTYLYRTQ